MEPHNTDTPRSSEMIGRKKYYVEKLAGFILRFIFIMKWCCFYTCALVPGAMAHNWRIHNYWLLEPVSIHAWCIREKDEQTNTEREDTIFAIIHIIIFVCLCWTVRLDHWNTWICLITWVMQMQTQFSCSAFAVVIAAYFSFIILVCSWWW